jgi:Na+-translocating ferredoxin:NAD+ oxidoreductase RnfC subunit
MTDFKMTLVQDIKSWGIVGAGGAGFPTHVKLSSPAEIFIVNAAECEPLLHKDKELLRVKTEIFFKGLLECLKLVSAKRAIIGIKAKYRDLIAHLQRDCPKSVEIIGLKDFYPVGDEVTLIFETTGRIVPAGALPNSIGVTVCNVETIYNIGRQRPLISKYLSIGGDVRHPVTIKVPIGISFREVLALAQPIPLDFEVIVGGPMMGQLTCDLEQPVTKTTGGLLVFPESHTLIQRYKTAAAEEKFNRIGKSACDQCSICSELCPRHLLGHPIEPHQAMRSLMFESTKGVSSAIEPHTMYCCQCNLCSLISCPEGLYPAQRCMLGRRRAIAAKVQYQQPVSNQAHPLIDFRRTPVSKIMARLDLKKFNNSGKLTAVNFNPSKLTVRLDQHIGAPATALLDVGTTVETYQKIAAVGEKLGVDIHAPANGEVCAVTDREIVISVA